MGLPPGAALLQSDGKMGIAQTSPPFEGSNPRAISEFGETVGAGDDVERASLDVIVDARKVLAEYAKKDQLYSPQEQYSNQGRRLAEECIVA